jgi:uncharacterized RDD family membrane protein YckC
MFCPKCGHANDEQAQFCQNCGTALITSGQPPGMQRHIGTATFTEYAGFWRRFAATVIDGILVSIVLFIVTVVLRAIGLLGVQEGEGDIIVAIVNIVIPWIYGAAMESSAQQATLGKMALGIMVTDTDGQPISFGQATGRYFGKIVSALILGIGFLMAGFTAKKQALHDIMAGCLVVVKA